MLSIPSASDGSIVICGPAGISAPGLLFLFGQRHSHVLRLLSYIWLFCAIYQKNTPERKITPEVNASI